jgi:hypothetical protein
MVDPPGPERLANKLLAVQLPPGIPVSRLGQRICDTARDRASLLPHLTTRYRSMW